MRIASWILTGCVALVVAAGLTAALRAGEERPAVPEERRMEGVLELVSARPFTLERPWTHWWRAEQPRFDAGWLVVLRVDPRFVEPRQGLEPVLYAGAETVERVNFGQESGQVVAVVPSARGADGAPALELARVAFFFGPEELPERVTAAAAAAQSERALRAGARPFSEAEIASALQQGGGLARLGAREELDELTALLVLQHSPAEEDLGTGLLAPRVR